ncbi:MAG: hypothetical protein L6277_07945 [Desulfobacterales bacterium]|nr:hypothetical protein [Pseudomonadota bacterium]MBU4354585.1 hypothetical protein [Pseudomonadota bacterium]MCG2772003.1 hypothetical protein [Desulfobacterales bacterium]
MPVLQAGKVGQENDGGTHADFFIPAASSHHDRPGKFTIFREDFQFKPYLHGSRNTNDMEK